MPTLILALLAVLVLILVLRRRGEPKPLRASAADYQRMKLFYNRCMEGQTADRLNGLYRTAAALSPARASDARSLDVRAEWAEQLSDLLRPAGLSFRKLPRDARRRVDLMARSSLLPDAEFTRFRATLPAQAAQDADDIRRRWLASEQAIAALSADVDAMKALRRRHKSEKYLSIRGADLVAFVAALPPEDRHGLVCTVHWEDASEPHLLEVVEVIVTAPDCDPGTCLAFLVSACISGIREESYGYLDTARAARLIDVAAGPLWELDDLSGTLALDPVTAQDFEAMRTRGGFPAPGFPWDRLGPVHSGPLTGRYEMDGNRLCMSFEYWLAQRQ